MLRTNIAVVLVLLLIAYNLGGAVAQDAPADAEQIEPLGIIVLDCVPVAGGAVLCELVDYDFAFSGFALVDALSGEQTPWVPDWRPEDDGWEPVDNTAFTILEASPDGQWVCFDYPVYLPEDIPITHEGMRWVQAVVLSRADGTGARAVALSILVGGGPGFAFSHDGRRIYGSPILPCEPDAEHFAEFASATDGWVGEPCNYIEVATGARGYQEGVELGDGFWKCPYSDNYRIENNWYAVHEFGNLTTGGILGRWESPDERSAYVDGWVLADAVLLSGPAAHGLLYVDGRFVPAPSEGWHCYGWLGDGTYIFSDDGGETVKYGKVDWSSFTVDWWVARPDLAGCVDGVLYPVAGIDALVIFDPVTSMLRLTRVTREGARP